MLRERARSGEPVVEPEAGTQLPRRHPAAAIERHEEAAGAREGRRHAGHSCALRQRLAHQRELPVLEVAQPAVEHVARLAAGAACEVATLEHGDGEAVAGCETRHREPDDPAAHDHEVERFHSTATCARRSAAPGS